MKSESWESFTISGSQVGFLQRRSQTLDGLHRVTETLTTFFVHGERVRLHHTLRWTEEQPPTWSSYSWNDGKNDSIEVERAENRISSVRDNETRESEIPAHAWPGYGCVIRLRELRLTPGNALSYPVLTDSSAEVAGEEQLLVVGPEEVPGVDGRPLAGLVRVEHRISGEIHNNFWIDAAGTPVVSDWNGARSYRVSGREEALAGVGDLAGQLAPLE